MNDLLQRIDDFQRGISPECATLLLADCRYVIVQQATKIERITSDRDLEKKLRKNAEDDRETWIEIKDAEIKSLMQENETLKHNCAHYADRAHKLDQRLYVPMTRDEKMELSKHVLRSDSPIAVVDETEAAVIKRAGLKLA